MLSPHSSRPHSAPTVGNIDRNALAGVLSSVIDSSALGVACSSFLTRQRASPLSRSLVQRCRSRQPQKSGLLLCFLATVGSYRGWKIGQQCRCPTGVFRSRLNQRTDLQVIHEVMARGQTRGEPHSRIRGRFRVYAETRYAVTTSFIGSGS